MSIALLELVVLCRGAAAGRLGVWGRSAGCAALSVGLSVGCSTPSDALPGGMGGSASSNTSGSAGAMSGGGGSSSGAASAGSGGIAGGGAGLGGDAGTGQGGKAPAGGAGGMGGGGGGANKSGGCGSPRTLQDGNHMFHSGGAQRSYALRVPADYDADKPYRLMLGFHGANGTSADIAPSYFGLWDLAQGSTIFAAPDGLQKLWNATTDVAMVEALLEELEADLCIDKSRVGIEGFSQGGAMVWTLACALPGRFQFAIVHSGGGLAMPSTCKPIPFFSSLGNDGSGQDMSSDLFAMTNGCTVETMPMPPPGGHVCTDYSGCSAGYPTRWCDYDAGHTFTPTDPGTNESWMPQEVWTFVSQR